MSMLSSSSSKPAILVTAADLAPAALAMLGDYEVVFAGKTPQSDELTAICRRLHPVAIIARYGKVTREMIDAAQELKVISKHGSGVDTIDVAAAQSAGIAVKSAAGANAVAVAEHAMALLLACAKSIVHMNARMHSGHWDKATQRNIELNGRTLGLVGLGAIGRRVATMAQAFGMKVIGFDPFAGQFPPDVQQVDLATLWQQSDAISLHCPLTDDNRRFINASAIAQMKPGVFIVNTARGGLIDEEALLAAVRSGQVACAALDSFAEEPPPPNHPFFGEPNFILSPHIAGVTTDAYVNMGVAAAQNVLSVLAGQHQTSSKKEPT